MRTVDDILADAVAQARKEAVDEVTAALTKEERHAKKFRKRFDWRRAMTTLRLKREVS